MSDLYNDPSYDGDRQIDCPIVWCEGWVSAHGGEGQPIDEWVHGSTDVVIEPGMRLTRLLIDGRELVGLDFDYDRDGAHGKASLLEIADELAMFSKVLRARAEELP